MRSSAFGELQRSMEESGEGLVSRMRDWEREHANVHPGSPSRPSMSMASSAASWGPSSPRSWPESSDERFDDEDDIQIVSGDSYSDGASELFSRHPDSDAEMDLDQPVDIPARGTRYSSPGTSCGSAITGYASDDDAPALSFVSTNSARSSLLSFHAQQTCVTDSAPLGRPPSHSNCAPNGSPSDKAIAALALVMANGAGGLNDYEAARASGGQRAALDDSLVGEMWH